jgi:hypothetical protein
MVNLRDIFIKMYLLMKRIITHKTIIGNIVLNRLAGLKWKMDIKMDFKEIVI